MNVRPSFLAPEVIQTSAMDCGPAALKCLLEGFGIPVSYGRLREACQTDVDGTSIDALEDIANQLGLVVQQEMTPVDHLFVDEKAFLPALIVSVLPDGNTHFIILWRTFGPFVQVMDPSKGRRWQRQQHLLREIYRHRQRIDAATWRAWAGGEGFLALLQKRIAQLEVTDSVCKSLFASATEDPTWWGLAALDATVRLVASLLQGNGIQKGEEAEQLVVQLFTQALQEPAEATKLIPSAFWSIQAVKDTASPTEEEVVMSGAVLLHVVNRQSADSNPQVVPTELGHILSGGKEQPLWEIWQAVRIDSLWLPLALLVALTLAAIGAFTEMFLLRNLLGSITTLTSQTQVGAEITVWMGLLILLACGLFVLDAGVTASTLWIGRHLEIRLRIALLRKLARLSDHYFHSRLLSDTALRAHEIVALRAIPNLVVKFLRTSFHMLFTIMGLAILSPASLPISLFTLLLIIAITLATKPYLSEQDMRVRVHGSALNRFYLDGLLGILPLRTHGAERALRREQEGILVGWSESLAAFHQSSRWIQLATSFVGTSAAIYIIFTALARGGSPNNLFLLLYWTLNLPVLGLALVELAMQYPSQRNRILRLLEPIHAPEEDQADVHEKQAGAIENSHPEGVTEGRSLPATRASALSVRFENVSVHAGGHTILREIDLCIGAGDHVAIVGASGAGKSSLIGLLLGWQRAAAGQIWIDHEPLTGERLRQLRCETAWVDPSVQLWNRTLLDNLLYGAKALENGYVQEMLADADLFRVLENLPNGLQTHLGEGGGLVSGGEGQRVRLGRALLRPQVRLVILDEPFRGLDRTQRRRMLRAARQHWQSATLICITHDVSETLDFPRLLLLDSGRIIEDGDPHQLAADSTSRYRQMLDTEEVVQHGLWQGPDWHRLWMEGGKLTVK